MAIYQHLTAATGLLAGWTDVNNVVTLVGTSGVRPSI
jgi:hypothetical protein